MIRFVREEIPSFILETFITEQAFIDEWVQKWDTSRTGRKKPYTQLPHGYHKRIKFFKQVLLKSFSQKCPFCEMTLNSNGKLEDVDWTHYRPYNPIKDEDNHFYFWLVFQWPNLYLTCKDCKDAYWDFTIEGTDFRIDKNQGMRASIGEYFVEKLNKQEHPLVLDPCYDEPQEYLEFYEKHDGQIWLKSKNDNERGNETIRAFNLNRKDLRESRTASAQKFDVLLDQAKQLSSPLGKSESSEKIIQISSEVAPINEFAGMKRDLLNNYIVQIETIELRTRLQTILDDSLVKEPSVYHLTPSPTPNVARSADVPPLVFRSRELIINDPAILLPHVASTKGRIVRKILERLFVDYLKIEVLEEYSAGFSGAKVYCIRLFITNNHSTTSRLPVVVKIAQHWIIQKERNAYHNLIKDNLPNAAKIRESEEIVENGFEAIIYELIGEGEFEFHSFKSFLLEATYNHIDIVKKFFREELFKVFHRLWNFSTLREDFNYCLYEHLLPVNLIIQYQPAGTMSPKSLTPADLGHENYSIDDNVSLSGFEVVEINLEKKELMLDCSMQLRNDKRFRFKVKGVETISSFQIGQHIHPESPIDGYIIHTRPSLLTQFVNQALNISLNENSELVFLNNTQFKNPILTHADFFKKTFKVKMSSVHGDANLENILVKHDPDNMQYRDFKIIDFANTRKDHVLHDFLRLETSIWLYIASIEFDQNSFGQQIATIFEAVHSSDNIDPQLENLKSLHILREIRYEAERYLMNRNGWDEYYRGLVLYMLGALKFKNLDHIDTHPSPKEIAFWVACLANHFIDNKGFENVPIDDSSPEGKSPESGQQLPTEPHNETNDIPDPAEEKKWLHNAMDEFFKLSDIKALCLEINIVDYENLTGDTRKEKIMDLIVHYRNAGKMSELLAYCARERPHHNWDDMQY